MRRRAKREASFGLSRRCNVGRLIGHGRCTGLRRAMSSILHAEFPGGASPTRLAGTQRRARAAPIGLSPGLLRRQWWSRSARRPACRSPSIYPTSSAPVRQRRAAFTVVFHDQTALLATLTRGHVGLLEAYFDERVDLEGDLGCAFAASMTAGFDLRSSPINAIENRAHGGATRTRRLIGQRRTRGRTTASAPTSTGSGSTRCSCTPAATGRKARRRLKRRSAPRSTTSAARSASGRATASSTSAAAAAGGFMLRAHETTGARGTGVNTTTEQVEWLRGEIARRGLESELAVREADFVRSMAVTMCLGVAWHAMAPQVRRRSNRDASELQPRARDERRAARHHRHRHALDRGQGAAAKGGPLARSASRSGRRGGMGRLLGRSPALVCSCRARCLRRRGHPGAGASA